MTRELDGKSTWRNVIVVILIVANSMGCTRAHAPVTDSSPAQAVALSGVVRDSSATIANVRVTLARAGSIRAEFITRRDGSFSFVPQPPGDYQFSAYRSGYALCAQTVTLLWPDQSITARLTSTRDSARAAESSNRKSYLCSCRILRPNYFTHSAPAGATTDSALFRDTLSTRIVVKVVDAEDGQIVNRALVTIAGNGIANDHASNQMTDANGFAVFSKLPAGEFRVLTRRIGFDFDARQVVVKAASTQSLTVQMRWGGDQCLLVMTQ